MFSSNCFHFKHNEVCPNSENARKNNFNYENTEKIKAASKMTPRDKLKKLYLQLNTTPKKISIVVTQKLLTQTELQRQTIFYRLQII